MTALNVFGSLTPVATTLLFPAIGLLGLSVIARVGYQRHSLTRPGAVGTKMVGTARIPRNYIATEFELRFYCI